MAFLLIATTLFVLLSTSNILCYLKHRHQAKASGLSYVSVPVFEINIFYGLRARNTRIYTAFIDRLPTFLAG
jgi:hypothetical protein